MRNGIQSGPKSILASIATLGLAMLPVQAEPWTRVVPEEIGMSSERLDRLTGVMKDYVENGDVAGLVIMIAKDGKLAYELAIGKRDLESGDPISMGTIFRIASQTKALVSAGVMSLQEEGKLLISEPVEKYLPEFEKLQVSASEDGGATMVPANRSITIRDLLTHTSGIPYGGWLNGVNANAWKEAGFSGWYLASGSEPIREVVRKMAALPLVSQPGEKWNYGYNTDILGAIIEVVSGQSLDQFLKERFFDPLDMEDTHFWLPAEKENRLATVYHRNGPSELAKAADGPGMWTQGEYVVGQGPNVTMSGGAGLLSTADDYLSFMEMLRRGGTTQSGERILSPSTIDLMTVNHIGSIPFPFEKGMGFGLGFAVSIDKGVRAVLGNEGEFRWGGAYHTTYWIDPEEELSVVYLAQMGQRSGLDIHSKLRALVYQAVAE